MKRSWRVMLGVFGLATLALAVFIWQEPGDRRGAVGAAVFGLCMVGGAIYRTRVPLLRIGDSGLYRSKGEGILWEEIEGLVIVASGGVVAAHVVPKDPNKRPSRGMLGQLNRRLDTWLMGRPVWGGIPMTGISKEDLEFIAQQIEGRAIPEIQARSLFKRLLWFLGP